MWILIASLSGITAILAGTLAAHLLAAEPHGAQLMSTGAHYAMVHALALLATALLGRGETKAAMLRAAGWLFTAGIILFSGSLYALALTGFRPVAWLTPFGGLAFLLGWAALGLQAWRRLRSDA
ncbi:MAG TPA: DUF423 domain-containing protein [Stellaceae bacterium]|nr:DUF423 domain-containing protein [Stellaceae bacterium]